MKRSEIKLGVVYGVRLSTRFHAWVVPARVTDLNAPYPYRIGRWGSEDTTAQNGGVRVVFTRPTRIGVTDFALAARTNENAGPITRSYTFGDKRNRAGVGKHFVGVWADMEHERKAGR